MKFPLLALLAIAVFAAAVTHARPGAGTLPESSTRVFSMDGRRFAVETPGPGDLSLLERELKNAGLDSIPPDAVPSILPRPLPVLLRELPSATSGSVKALPAGLEAEHAIRMETESGPVEIAFGGVKAGAGNIHRKLCASGWECSGTDADDGMPRLATKTKGGDTSIVLLDRKEARFLFLRRLEE